MKAIKTTKGNIHNILFKSYSEDILGYSAILEGCGHFFIINSKYEGKADEIYSKLIILSKENCQNLVLLQKSGNVLTTDNLNFLEKSGNDETIY